MPVAALGLVMPSAMAMALEHLGHWAATTLSLFGSLQMNLFAVITAAVGAVLNTSPLPMYLAMPVVAIVALGLAVC